jgi:peptide/nickel transport system substrate-binding protein
VSLRTSTNEYSRLQAAVIQHDLKAVGVDLEVRTQELATLFADVLSGNFELHTLQWSGGALADPDILRRIFHSSQVPPLGFNRGFFKNAEVDRLLDEASAATGADERHVLFAEVQRIVTEQAVYIGLWHKTNFAIARRDVTGVRLSPTADFLFLKDAARAEPDPAH